MFILALVPSAGSPSVLLVSGQNNHDWVRTTEYLQTIVRSADRFDITVSLTPPAGADAAAWEAWRPDFSAHDVVLLNYNGEMWPEPVKSDFEAYVSGGGRVLIQHAANNPFPGWEAYESMTGLLWRGSGDGYRVYVNGKGTLVRLPPGEGRGAGHGTLHDWEISTRDATHPIMKDLPPVWLHPHDELYHGQRGPAQDMHILATAWSDPAYGGTGEHELMLWWIPFGAGKVLTLLPGHLWGGQEDDRALRCAGFQTLLQRSLEWLATGEVTSPVPGDFPTAEAVSVRSWQERP